MAATAFLESQSRRILQLEGIVIEPTSQGGQLSRKQLRDRNTSDSRVTWTGDTTKSRSLETFVCGHMRRLLAW
jgi:hypothetical protein